MLDFNKLKVGEVLSESSYFTISNIQKDQIEVEDSFGNKGLKISKQYVEAILSSAIQYTTEEKISQTEMINIVSANPRTAMTIYFRKADKVKTKKAFKADLELKAIEVQKDFLDRGKVALEEALVNPVLDYIPGEMREIKGYFIGTQDERGRFQFKDMEDSKKLIKGVDSRTINYVIVNNIKYILK